MKAPFRMRENKFSAKAYDRRETYFFVAKKFVILKDDKL